MINGPCSGGRNADEPGRQDYLHIRWQPGYRPCHSAARSARRREYRRRRKDGGAHAKLEGTIYTAAEQIDKAGGRALPLVVDIRDEERVAEAIREAADKFGGIDILINNASAIRTTGTLDTPVRRYDLMHGVNGRGTFVCSQACLPYLMKAKKIRTS